MEGLTAIGRTTVVLPDLNYVRRQRIRQVEEAFGLYPTSRLEIPLERETGKWSRLRRLAGKPKFGETVW
jgi:hypothetical protein